MGSVQLYGVVFLNKLFFSPSIIFLIKRIASARSAGLSLFNKHTNTHSNRHLSPPHTYTTTMSSTATTNTMPAGTTITLTTSQLMKMLAEAKAEGRTEVLQELGMASTGAASSAAQPAASAPTVAQDTATQPPPKKKRKRITLPDGTTVKNLTSAYIFFCNKHRAETKEANPDLKPKELTAILGAKWSALTDEEKVPYKDLAATDKERYLAQVAQAAEVSAGVSMGAISATAAPAPAAAQPAAPPVLPGGDAAPTLDIQPVPPPSPSTMLPAAPTVFKTGASNASSSA